MTKQEIELILNPVVKVDLDKDEEKFLIDYASEPHIVFGEKIKKSITNRQKNRKVKRPHRQTQLKLL